MNHLFVLVREQSMYDSMIDSFFREVSTLPEFITITESELNERWKQLLISKKGQRYTCGKLNWLLWDSYDWVKKAEIFADQYDQVFILFTNISFLFHRPPIEVINKLKKRNKNINLILLYIDMVSRSFASYYSNKLREQGAFDLVYSFDKKDARKYGLIYRRTPYSPLRINESKNGKWDLYYCAYVKERGTQIKEILDAGMRKCSIHMDLFDNNNEKILEPHYNKAISPFLLKHSISYDEVIKRTLNANCILDICLPSQRGLSLRAYEAVVYNKKLLTNNPAIVDYEYYNKEYMYLYNSVDEIDWEWVSEKRDIDYHYQNDYSPRFLLEDIKNRISL